MWWLLRCRHWTAVIDVAWVSLLLILNIYFKPWSRDSIVSFEQVIARREYISIICNCNICVFFNIDNRIVKNNYNISVLILKVIFLIKFTTCLWRGSRLWKLFHFRSARVTECKGYLIPCGWSLIPNYSLNFSLFVILCSI